MTSTSFPSWPYFDEATCDAVRDVLVSGRVNYWTGTQGQAFEDAYASSLGVNYAIAVSNGTVALELALRALGIGPGDEVIVPARTFIGSASCVVAVGAKPVVVDVDPASQNLTSDTITPALTEKTKAIIVVHLAGWPADMPALMAFAKSHGLKVIEDCAQAHGAAFAGRPVGTFGDINTFSFCQDKILTTGGEGGLVVTNEKTLWEKAWQYKDHGKAYDKVHAPAQAPGFRWLHEDFGTNFRMTEMQAAIGLHQLKALPDWVATRRQHAALLDAAFARTPGLRVVTPPSVCEHAYYKYYVQLELDQLKSGWDRNRVMHEITQAGVPCFSGSCPEIYLERAFTHRGWQPAARLPVAKQLGETSLMFLVHPTLQTIHLEQTATVVSAVLEKAVATVSP